jgi:RND superfamily putative drug exporter
MNALLERLGRFAVRRHWLVIIGWLVILGAAVLLRNNFGGNYVNDYNVPGSQSAQGLSRLQSDFPSQSGNSGQLVFHSHHGTVAEQTTAVNQAVSNASKLPHVMSAVSPFASSNSTLVSKDGTIAYGTLSFNVVPATLDTGYLDKLNTAVQPARSAGLEVEYGTGAGQIGQEPDDLTSEIIGLSCALLLLIGMFGALIAAAIPLLSAIFSVVTGLSLVGLLAAATNLPTTAATVATLLGLGVAVDYGLFLVARHREQIDSGMGVEESVTRAEGTSGAAIVVAGSTVVVASLGLYVSGVPFVGALGAASALVVAVTMLAALTLVPAFMGVAGNNIRALRVRLRARRARRRAGHNGSVEKITPPDHENSPFARWGRKVSGNPWPWAIGSVAVLVLLAVPFFSMRLGQLDNGSNPTSQTSRRAYDLINQGFGPGYNGPITVVVVLPKASTSSNQSLLSSMQSTLTKTPGVAVVPAPVVNSAGTTAIINVIQTTEPQAEATTNLVDNLRNSVLPPLGAKTYLTGATAGGVDFTEKAADRMPYLILAVVFVAFILLTIAFRSVVIATKAAILNLLSVGAAYGVIVAIFQWGWGSSWLGIDEKLPIPAYVPMLVFAIVFGLSMDYEVFLLSRVHEAYVRTKDEQRSVALGIGSTARVITTAAAIMVVVFTSFVLNPDPAVKMLAIGMAVAVLIDASLVRMMLVPAIMSLLGSHAWWMPHWMERIVPNLELEGSPPGPPPTPPAPAKPGVPETVPPK